MRQLALQRGTAVRDALIAKGLPSERLFIASPKVRGAGESAEPFTPSAKLSLAN
jgi:outer membrane protein OmpA-like peptidoglycan-associated protein